MAATLCLFVASVKLALGAGTIPSAILEADVAENSSCNLLQTDIGRKLSTQDHAQVGEVPVGRSEEFCQVVSSHGIMRSCDVYPLAPKSDDLFLDSDYYVDEMKKKGNGAIVYVTTTALPVFLLTVMPQIHDDFRFVLVTGDSIVDPSFILGQGTFTKLANDKRVLKWFAQDAVDAAAHEKVTQMPLGLDYHEHREEVSPLDQEAELLAIRTGAKQLAERKPKAFAAMRGDTGFGKREVVLDALHENPNLVDMFEPNFTRQDFWAKVAEYRNVVSPEGNGPDCHRTWETLILGGVPIIQPSLSSLFGDNGIPVVVADSDVLATLSVEELKKKTDEAIAATVDPSVQVPEALKLEYWVKKIRAATSLAS